MQVDNAIRLPGALRGAFGGKVASPRELDEQLQAGIVPEDAFLQSRQERIEENQNLHHLAGYGEVFSDALIGAVGGTLLGGSVFAMHPLAFALSVVGGAALGGLWARRGLARTDAGQVRLNIDGQTTVKPFRGPNPAFFATTPQEMRSYLLATQRIGETVPLPTPQSSASAAEAEATWLPAAKPLVALGEGRRLVGDLGLQTSYDRPALNLIDASRALQLLDSGKGVYALEVTDEKDVAHNFTVDGSTPAGNLQRLEDYRWTERQVSYHLVPLHEPSDLQAVAATPGLPAGLVGVVAGTDHYAERVFQKDVVEGRSAHGGFRNEETTWHS